MNGKHRRGLQLSGCLQGDFDSFQKQQEGQRSVQHGNSSITRIPSSYLFVLGVDEKSYAAHLGGSQQAAPSRCQQELATYPLSLYLAIHCEARKSKCRYVVPSESAPHNLRRRGVDDGCRTQAVKA